MRRNLFYFIDLRRRTRQYRYSEPHHEALKFPTIDESQIPAIELGMREGGWCFLGVPLCDLLGNPLFIETMRAIKEARGENPDDWVMLRRRRSY